MIQWNKVTWYSKIAALVVFLGFVPMIAFYIGLQYAFTVVTLSSTQNNTADVSPVSNTIHIDKSR